jgi:hypothetical protein
VPSSGRCCVDLRVRRWTERRLLRGLTPPFRDRLDGRTPRSERGGRGSSPCPGACGRVAQTGERLSYKQEAAGSTPASPIRVAVAQPVERPPEARGAAGSIPAGHISGSVAQTAELPALNRAVRVRHLPGPLWKDCHWRGIPSRKRVGLRALGVRLPLLPLAEAWPSWQGSAVLRRKAVPRLAGSSPAASASVRRSRVGKTRDC